MSRPVWHILTGEYPPQPGGVGDYSALLASGLAETGAEVHVWTAPALASFGETHEARGVEVHRAAGGWSPADLAGLGSALDRFPGPRKLVVQYAPNAWGYKGLNFGFCRWLLGRRRKGDEVRVMFHEVSYPFEFPDKPARWLLAAGHRLMARTLLKASSHVDVSIPAWGRMLRRCAPGWRGEIGWRPVPSNIPVVDDPEGVAAVRRKVAPGGEAVVGSFGTYSELVARMLDRVLPPLLDGRPDRVGLLLGHRGEGMAERLAARCPGLRGRIRAAGGLAPDELSRHLQACDVVIQPYPDGVTTRRGSVMAALAHGVATVSNAGHLTEPFWAETGGIGLAARPSPAEIVAVADRLLGDADERGRVGASGRALHESRFAIGRTVEALVGKAERVAP